MPSAQMADSRRFIDSRLGPLGILTYLPSEDPDKGPGSLFTSRRTANAPSFEIVGASAQIYPPSKVATPIVSAKQRRVQRRWLLNSHPEAFMGNSVFEDLLKEDVEQRKLDRGPSSAQQLLAIGQMTDKTGLSEAKSLPVMAAATGVSGEQLRLTRIHRSKWRWEDSIDAMLNILLIDPVPGEDEAMWANDSLPITQIKFAATSTSQLDSGWILLVQTAAMTTILHPELRPDPDPDSSPPSSSTGPPGCINPNPLLTLHCNQTGGNPFKDVAYNPSTPTRLPQLAVIDEKGDWSVWDIAGSWKGLRNTLRLSISKCGNILEGILGSIPSSPSQLATMHGIFFLGRDSAKDVSPASASTPSERFTEELAFPSKRIVLWNTECLEIMNLEGRISLPKLDMPSSSRHGPDPILAVQRSPVNENHLFVMTTQQVIWIEVFCGDNATEAPSQPKILLACSHVGVKNEDMGMSVCRGSGDEQNTALVFTWSSKAEQLYVYWFNIQPESGTPHWHRHTTSLPSCEDRETPTEIALIKFMPAEIESSEWKSKSGGRGISYIENKIHFYQFIVLGADLSVRHGICATSRDYGLEIILPTKRAEGGVWGQRSLRGTEVSRRERERLRRARQLNQNSQRLRRSREVFVLPDSMGEAGLGRRPETEQRILDENSKGETVPPLRPTLLKLDRILDALGQQLYSTTTQGGIGIPVAVLDALVAKIDDGLAAGRLPLTTWAEVAEGLESNQTSKSFGYASDEELNQVWNRSDGRVVVKQLANALAKNDSERATADLPSLFRRFSKLWLEPTRDILSEDLQVARRAWVAEVARDVFLSSFGVVVQDTPLFLTRDADHEEIARQELADEEAIRSSAGDRPPRISSSSSESPSSSSASQPAQADGALERLQLLAPGIKAGELDVSRQCKVLSYWPRKRGVGTEGYVSSVALATEEMFKGAKQRRQKMEARLKAQAEKYRRPAFMRQGFPAGEEAKADDGSGLAMRPAPWQVMSSQQAPPDSSQAMLGPSVAMSQPESGAFGGRKKAKGKRKSGFR